MQTKAAEQNRSSYSLFTFPARLLDSASILLYYNPEPRVLCAMCCVLSYCPVLYRLYSALLCCTTPFKPKNIHPFHPQSLTPHYPQSDPYESLSLSLVFPGDNPTNRLKKCFFCCCGRPRFAIQISSVRALLELTVSVERRPCSEKTEVRAGLESDFGGRGWEVERMTRVVVEFGRGGVVSERLWCGGAGSMRSVCCSTISFWGICCAFSVLVWCCTFSVSARCCTSPPSLFCCCTSPPLSCRSVSTPSTPLPPIAGPPIASS